MRSWAILAAVVSVAMARADDLPQSFGGRYPQLAVRSLETLQPFLYAIPNTLASRDEPGVTQSAAAVTGSASASRVIGRTAANGATARSPAECVGDIDELWKLPRPTGRGGPWRDTAVAAGVPSDPYLMGGYDEKTLELSHDGTKPVHVIVEIDPTGDGEWFAYATLDVPAGEPLLHRFPDGFLAQWVRLTADAACRATATLTYR